MTPQSGAISFSHIANELGLSLSNVSLGSSTIREYAFVPSGAINFNDCRGIIKHTQTTNSQGNSSNQYTGILAQNTYGWNSAIGPYKMTYIVNSGVILSGGGGNYEFGFNANGNGYVNLINNGTIVGSGGNGGASAQWPSTAPAAAGQPGIAGVTVQLSSGRPLNITNNGTIGGGGGGGAGGYSNDYGGGGGGGGGGYGIGYSGVNCGWAGCGYAGVNGTVSGGGRGGQTDGAYASDAGAGGSAGSNGGNGGGWYAGTGGGGGGIGASGGRGQFGDDGGPWSVGGSAGACTSTSSGTVTWVTTGTRYGSLN